MEAVERVSAEEVAGPCRRATYLDLRQSGAHVANPLSFDLPPTTSFREDALFEWVEGWELFSAKPIWILADLARSPPREGVLDQVDTNGLAAGFSYGAALRSALLEVVERDGVSHHHFFELYGFDGDVGPPRRRINATSIPATARKLVERARELHLDIVLEDFSGELGIPIVSCTLMDPTFPTPKGPALFMFGGWSADLAAESALTRAIVESFQSRLGVIHGARDSFNQVSHSTRRFTSQARRRVLHAALEYEFSTIPNRDVVGVEAEVNTILELLGSAGLGQAIVVDLRRRDLEVPAVRVRVPGLSAFTVDRRRVGWRCARYIL
jgi:YcaO-like protein with predicted kinase domain